MGAWRTDKLPGTTSARPSELPSSTDEQYLVARALTSRCYPRAPPDRISLILDASPQRPRRRGILPYQSVTRGRLQPEYRHSTGPSIQVVTTETPIYDRITVYVSKYWTLVSISLQLTSNSATRWDIQHILAYSIPYSGTDSYKSIISPYPYRKGLSWPINRPTPGVAVAGIAPFDSLPLAVSDRLLRA